LAGVVVILAACLGSRAVTAPSGASQTSLPTFAPTAGQPMATPPATAAEIERLTAVVEADPGDEAAQRDLGFAIVQRVRETADPALYKPAMDAFEAALAIEPEDAMALVGVASIQLGRHEFAAALATAEQAIDLSPSLVPAHAARVDALVELGRYGAADAAAGEMLGLQVDRTTLARVSYLAELRGDLPTALAGMRRAVASPGLAPENTAYLRALVANLLIYSGDPDGARVQLEAALDLVPDHAPSLAAEGRLAVGAGDLETAIAQFGRAAAIVPLPEYVIALGDAQSAAGEASAASQSYDLAAAEIRLFEANGVVVDVELALFEADHGDPGSALRHAEAAYASTPTVRAADAVAWALHRLGRDDAAMPYVTEALRLGSIDPTIRYHAGVIAGALGDARAARRDLELALRTDPGFSAVGSLEARRLLAELP
jgi:tetratricopeptide (TPR) repeat protein